MTCRILTRLPPAAAMVTALLMVAAPLPSEYNPQLAMPGVFHAGDITVENGSTWLAVVPQRNHGFVIEEAAVVVEAVHDPIADVEGEMTGVRISAPSCFRTPLFLVRGVDAIQTGFFETTHDEPLPLVINQPLPITVLSRRHYALLVTCESAASDSGDTLVECPLVLVHDHTEQLLAVFTALISAEGRSSFADDAAPRLLWAGDIDRDLELDLLLDLTNHYNVKAPTLFLSSEASEGELVAEVASLFLTGC